MEHTRAAGGCDLVHPSHALGPAAWKAVRLEHRATNAVCYTKGSTQPNSRQGGEGPSGAQSEIRGGLPTLFVSS